jgi:hypothetical protein
MTGEFRRPAFEAIFNNAKPECIVVAWMTVQSNRTRP